jgi:uncharacterized protein YecT (DUF1311 family)
MTVSNKKFSTIKIVFLSALLLSVSIGFSQNEKHPIDINNEQCHDNSTPTTNSAVECESEALKAWENEMKTYLNLLKEKHAVIDTTLLQKAQEHWFAFYTTDTAIYNSYLNHLYQGGTLSRIAVITYKKATMRERALDLKAFYTDLN